MPVQISTLESKTISDRVRDFAAKIPDGLGYSVGEIAQKFGASYPATHFIVRKLGIKLQGIKGVQWYLVNPKTKESHAKKN